MTRLVLVLSGPGSGWPAVQRQLVADRERLATAGVLVPDQDAPGEWNRLVEELLGSGPAPALDALAERARATGATLLLGSDRWAAHLADRPEQAATLRHRAEERGLAPTLAVIAADPLDQLNRAYCAQVLSLSTDAGFADWLRADPPPRPLDPGALAAAAAAHDLSLTGVLADRPADRLADRRPADALLEACGLPIPDPAPGDGPGLRPEPGPALIAATLLLNKRLRRNGHFGRRARADLVALAARLRRTAAEQDWDEEPFYGWTAAAAAEATARYSTGQEEFAQRVWGTPWPTAGPREQNVIVLGWADPALVAAALDAVDALVAEAGPARREATTPLRARIRGRLGRWRRGLRARLGRER